MKKRATQKLAAFHRMKISECIRHLINEAAENFYDTEAIKEVQKDFEEHPETMNHDEFWEGLA